jgi:hypothetical protein
MDRGQLRIAVIIFSSVGQMRRRRGIRANERKAGPESFRRGTRSGALLGCQTGIVMLVAASPAAGPATRWRRRFGSHACHY